MINPLQKINPHQKPLLTTPDKKNKIDKNCESRIPTQQDPSLSLSHDDAIHAFLSELSIDALPVTVPRQLKAKVMATAQKAVKKQSSVRTFVILFQEIFFENIRLSLASIALALILSLSMIFSRVLSHPSAAIYHVSSIDIDVRSFLNNTTSQAEIEELINKP